MHALERVGKGHHITRFREGAYCLPFESATTTSSNPLVISHVKLAVEYDEFEEVGAKLALRGFRALVRACVCGGGGGGGGGMCVCVCVMGCGVVAHVKG
jgi:predicted Rossmann-fold nucleotide-binding protein